MSKKEFTRPSAEQIAKWKERHKKVFEVKVEDEQYDTVRYAYLRKPKMGDIERAQSSDKAKAGTFNRSLWNNIVLSADSEINEEREDLMMAAYQQMGECIQVANASIKEL